MFMLLLNHGIFVGSQSGVNAGGFLYKTCKYLFVSGIAELPARGGLAAVVPNAPRGIELGDRGGQTLYCRLRAE